MSITQGSALPNVTVTTTKADTVPGYYTNYLQSLSDVGQTYIGKPATETTAAVPGRTAAEGIAGMDPLQTQGYGMVPSGASAYQGPLQQAMRTAGTAAAKKPTSKPRRNGSGRRERDGMATRPRQGRFIIEYPRGFPRSNRHPPPECAARS